MSRLLEGKFRLSQQEALFEKSGAKTFLTLEPGFLNAGGPYSKVFLLRAGVLAGGLAAIYG